MLGIIIVICYKSGPILDQLPRIIFGMVMFWFLIFSILAVSTNKIAIKCGIPGKVSVEINETEIKEITSKNESMYYWHGIHKIESDRHSIYIFVNPQAAIIIPKSIFEPIQQADVFLHTAMVYWKQSNVSASSVT